MKDNKRTQIVVNPKVQFKLLSIVVCVAIIPIIMLFFGLMLYSSQLINHADATREGLMTLLQAVQRLNIVTCISFIMILVILALVQMLYLHKIVGPLYRIEETLREVLDKKEYNRRIIIRKTDFLDTLVHALNDLIERLEKAAQ